MADKKKTDKPNRPAPRGTPEVTAYSPSPADKERLEGYWKRNIRLTLTLLAVWFIVGYVLAIIFAPALNTITFLGGPLASGLRRTARFTCLSCSSLSTASE